MCQWLWVWFVPPSLFPCKYSLMFFCLLDLQLALSPLNLFIVFAIIYWIKEKSFTIFTKEVSQIFGRETLVKSWCSKWNKGWILLVEPLWWQLIWLLLIFFYFFLFLLTSCQVKSCRYHCSYCLKVNKIREQMQVCCCLSVYILLSSLVGLNNVFCFVCLKIWSEIHLSMLMCPEQTI